MPKQTPVPVPSKTELEILTVLWDKQQATGREIFEALTKSQVVRSAIAYTTIKTYLDRMAQKGLVSVEVLPDGRGTRCYRAAVTRETIRDDTTLLDRLLRTLDVRPQHVVAYFHKKKWLSKQDIRALKNLLKNLPEE